MAGGKVYSYLFDQDFPLMGKSTPWHCADIPFVFHNTELVPVCAFEGAKQLEAEIFGAVMQFARTGAPGWAASTEDVEQTMLFGPQSRLVQNHDHTLIEALAPFTDLRMKKATRQADRSSIKKRRSIRGNSGKHKAEQASCVTVWRYRAGCLFCYDEEEWGENGSVR